MFSLFRLIGIAIDMATSSPLEPDRFRQNIYIWAHLDRPELEEVIRSLSNMEISISQIFANFLENNAENICRADIKALRKIVKKLDPFGRDAVLTRLILRITPSRSDRSLQTPAPASSKIPLKAYANLLGDDWISGIAGVEGGDLEVIGNTIEEMISSHEGLLQEKWEPVRKEIAGMLRWKWRIDRLKSIPAPQLQQEFRTLAQLVQQSILALKRGETLLLPWGYAAESGGHAMFLRFSRNLEGIFTLDVINTGEGAETYHDISYVGGVQYINPVCRFTSIPREALQSFAITTFFEAFAEPLILPIQEHLPAPSFTYDADTLYNLLVPFLPYREQSGAPMKLMKAQQSGTCSARPLFYVLHDLLQEDYRRIKIFMNLRLIENGLEQFGNELREPGNADMRKIFRHGCENTFRLLAKEMGKETADREALVQLGKRLAKCKEETMQIQREADARVSVLLQKPAFESGAIAAQTMMTAELLQASCIREQKEESPKASTAIMAFPSSFAACRDAVAMEELLKKLEKWLDSYGSLNRASLEAIISILLTLPLPSKTAFWYRLEKASLENISLSLTRLVNRIWNEHALTKVEISFRSIVLFHLMAAVLYDISILDPQMRSLASFGLDISYLSDAESRLWFCLTLDDDVKAKWAELKQFHEEHQKKPLFTSMAQCAIFPDEGAHLQDALMKYIQYGGMDRILRDEFRRASREYHLTLSFEEWILQLALCDVCEAGFYREFPASDEICMKLFQKYKRIRNVVQIAYCSVVNRKDVQERESNAEASVPNSPLVVEFSPEEGGAMQKKVRRHSRMSFSPLDINIDQRTRFFPFDRSSPFQRVEWCGVDAPSNKWVEGASCEENRALWERSLTAFMRRVYPALFASEGKSVRVAFIAECIERWPELIQREEWQSVLLSALFSGDVLRAACDGSPNVALKLYHVLKSEQETLQTRVMREKKKETLIRAIHVLALMQIGIVEGLYRTDPESMNRRLLDLDSFLSGIDSQNSPFERESRILRCACLKRVFRNTRSIAQGVELLTNYCFVCGHALDPNGKFTMLIEEEISFGEELLRSLSQIVESDRTLLTQVATRLGIRGEGAWEGSFPQWRRDNYTFDLIAGRFFFRGKPVSLDSKEVTNQNLQDFSDVFIPGRKFSVSQGQKAAHTIYRFEEGVFHVVVQVGESFLFHELMDGRRAYYFHKEKWGRFAPVLKVLLEGTRYSAWITEKDGLPEIVVSSVEDPSRVVWSIDSSGALRKFPENEDWNWLLLSEEQQTAFGRIAELSTIVVLNKRGGHTRVVYSDLLDEDNRPLEFIRDPDSDWFVWTADRRYHIAETVPMLATRHFSQLLILEDAEGNADKVLVPIRPRTQKSYSREDPQCRTILVDLNAQNELVAHSCEEHLGLAYMHLAQRDYVRAIFELRKAEKINGPYSGDELRLLGWIAVSDCLVKDNDVNAHAVRCFAAYLVSKNFRLNPARAEQSWFLNHDLETPFAAPDLWTSFWRGSAHFQNTFLSQIIRASFQRIITHSNDLYRDLMLFSEAGRRDSLMSASDTLIWLSENGWLDQQERLFFQMLLSNEVRTITGPGQDPMVHQFSFDLMSAGEREREIISRMIKALEAKKNPSKATADWIRYLRGLQKLPREQTELRSLEKLEEHFQIPSQIPFMAGNVQKPTFRTYLPFGLETQEFIERWKMVREGGEEEHQKVCFLLFIQSFPVQKSHQYRLSLPEALLGIGLLTGEERRKCNIDPAWWDEICRDIDESIRAGTLSRDYWETLETRVGRILPWNDIFSTCCRASLSANAYATEKIELQLQKKLPSQQGEPVPVERALMEKKSGTEWARDLFSRREPYSSREPEVRGDELEEEIRLGKERNERVTTYTLKEGFEETLKEKLMQGIYQEKQKMRDIKFRILALANRRVEDNVIEEFLELGGKKRKLALQDCIALFLQGSEEGYRDSTCLDPESIRVLHNLIFEYLFGKVEVQKMWRSLRHLLEALRSPEKEKLLGRAGAELLETRQIPPDPRIFSAALVFEAAAHVSINQKLMSALHRLAAREGGLPRSIVIQLIMGGGKTFVLGTIGAALNADGYHLSLFVLPSSLYETGLEDAGKRMETILGRRVRTFRFTREAAHIDVRTLSFLYRMLCHAIEHREVVVVTPETLAALENRFIELLGLVQERQKLSLKESTDFLRKILLLVRERGIFICDEADTIFDPVKEINFPSEKPLGPDDVSARLIQDLLLELLHDETLGPLLCENKQTLLSKRMSEKERHSKERTLIEKLLQKPEWIRVFCLSELDREELIAYIMGSSPDFSLVLERWHEGENPKHRRAAGLIVLCRQEITSWLWEAFTKGACEHYGLSFTEGTRSIASDQPEVAIPYTASNLPSYGSEFADQYRTILFTFHSYLIQGLPEEKKGEFAQYLLRKTGDRKEVMEALRKETGIDLVRLDPYKREDLDNLSSRMIGASGEAAKYLFDFVRERILPTMRLYKSQITSNPQNISSMACAVQTFSGTMNEAVFPERCGEVERDLGVNGETMDLLLRPERCHPEVAVLGEANKAAEVVRAGGDDAHALIDLGAYFQGVGNAQAARNLLNALSARAGNRIRGVLYFDDRTNLLCCLKEGEEKPIVIGSTNVKVIREKTKLGPEELYTYYDQRHHTGTDIVQCTGARGVVTIGADTTLDRLLQASMRMRRLSDSQTVVLAMTCSLYDSCATEGRLSVRDAILFTHKNQIRKRAQDALSSTFQKMHDALRRRCMDTFLTQEGFTEYARMKPILIRDVSFDLFEEFGKEQGFISLEEGLTGMMKKLLHIAEEAGLDDMALAKELHRIVRRTLQVGGLPRTIPIRSEDNRAREVTNIQLVELERESNLQRQELQETMNMSSKKTPPAVYIPWPEKGLEEALRDKRRVRPAVEHIRDFEITGLFSPECAVTDNFLMTVEGVSLEQIDLMTGSHKTPHTMLLIKEEEKFRVVLLSLAEASFFTRIFQNPSTAPRNMWLVTCDLCLCAGDQKEWTHEIYEHPEVRRLATQALVLAGRGTLLETERWRDAFDRWKDGHPSSVVDRVIARFSLLSSL